MRRDLWEGWRRKARVGVPVLAAAVVVLAAIPAAATLYPSSMLLTNATGKSIRGCSVTAATEDTTIWGTYVCQRSWQHGIEMFSTRRFDPETGSSALWWSQRINHGELPATLGMSRGMGQGMNCDPDGDHEQYFVLRYRWIVWNDADNKFRATADTLVKKWCGS